MSKLSELETVLEPVLIGESGADGEIAYDGVNTDSRSIVPGSVFVALCGEKFDGHDFVRTAQEKGAAAAVVQHPVDASLPQFVVTDTGVAYGLIAKAWRSRFALPLCMVAGSNGKTTTSQMLASILRARWGEQRMLATQGNLNNEVGVPKMLLRLDFEHRGAVIEAGISHKGEMARMADWVRPTVVLITNAQREHQEFLDGVEMSARENGLAIVALPETGTAVFPADDACADVWDSLALARGVNTLTYGLEDKCQADVLGSFADGVLTIKTPESDIAAKLAVRGEHNLHNAVGAAAAAYAMGIDDASIRKGLEAFRTLPGRGETFVTAGGVRVIDDAYNANPDSVRASLRVLAESPAPRTFVFGDMGEVGESAREAHCEVGAYAKELGIDALLCTGGNARLTAEAFGEGARWFGTLDELIEAVGSVRSGTVAVKASHFMGFEAVVRALREN